MYNDYERCTKKQEGIILKQKFEVKLQFRLFRRINRAELAEFERLKLQ